LEFNDILSFIGFDKMPLLSAGKVVKVMGMFEGPQDSNRKTTLRYLQWR
jgi:hypothetical protein